MSVITNDRVLVWVVLWTNRRYEQEVYNVLGSQEKARKFVANNPEGPHMTIEPWAVS